MPTAKLKKTGQAKRLKLPSYSARRRFLFVLMGLVGVALVGRALERQVIQTEFLQQEGARRYLRVIETPADRGPIVDRNGEALALSTPVDSIWADPRQLELDRQSLGQLAKALEMPPTELAALLQKSQGRSFVYLKRQVSPDISAAVQGLKLVGVHSDREYRRFYPAAEVVSHVLGFTNVDDQGQEGLELAFNERLTGRPGKKRVIRDGRRRIVKDVERIEPVRPGQQVQLSLDLRLQFLAYRALKSAMDEHNAIAGTAVLLDARKGEILAMVNQPGFNPNGNKARTGGRLRNRAVTDLFEPGSTIKPFVVAAALESGRYQPDTPVDTDPGYLRVGSGRVKDVHNYGLLDVAGVIRKSSNIGVTKIALDLGPERIWDAYRRVGVGQPLHTGFPGEINGRLSDPAKWREFDQAVISFGYGISLNALQLARAYAVLANDGLLVEPGFLLRSQMPELQRVMHAKTARQVQAMLEQVVSVQGTARRAAVPGYRIGGKTGTVKKHSAQGYADNEYQGVFVGMGPMSDPRLVMVVMIDEPRSGKYYGGQVAAPVFAEVMAGALRMMNIAPDAPQAEGLTLVAAGGPR
ncbi:penicillin-binding protein 2 [Magnetovirga frankeli]|uniref:peptidoglycan D,D-transpeptidase FtsI family protein n=1 Tax=Magnetovirga frankeli TaxID=947516 RepID=UPI00129373E8|nr:penicillin-binding protein 2 [gamma proteobacterium SS-5]